MKRLGGALGAAILCVIILAGAALAAGSDLISQGNQAAMKGNLAQAIQLYTQAIKSPGLSTANQAVAFNNRGSAQDDLGRTDLAIADFNRAISLDPGYAQAYYNRSFAFERKGQYKLAFADIQKAAQLDPADVDYKDRLQYLATKVK